MPYQVWTKDEYERWLRVDCEDAVTAKGEIFAAFKKGALPLLTIEVPYQVNIDIEEGKVIETA